MTALASSAPAQPTLALAMRHASRPAAPAVVGEPRRRRGGKGAVQLQWHDRICTAAGTAVQLRIPLVGRVDADLATRLSTYLDGELVGRPAPDGWTITSVAALTGPMAGVETLIVFLSVSRMPVRHRIDDSRMARTLQHAVDRCTQSR